jgi:hypothetical protein
VHAICLKEINKWAQIVNRHIAKPTCRMPEFNDFLMKNEISSIQAFARFSMKTKVNFIIFNVQLQLPYTGIIVRKNHVFRVLYNLWNFHNLPTKMLEIEFQGLWISKFSWWGGGSISVPPCLNERIVRNYLVNLDVFYPRIPIRKCRNCSPTPSKLQTFSWGNTLTQQ